MAKEQTDTEIQALKDQIAVMQQQFTLLGAQRGLGAAELKEILASVSESSARGMQKAMKPENEQSPLISAYNPAGDRDHPKQKLDRKTFLNGHPEHDSDSSLVADMLTAAEIDAYNQLGAACLAGNGHLEARNGLYKADLRLRNTELHINVPVANLDTRSNLPPTLILLCHEIKTGESMLDLDALMAELAQARVELAALKGPSAVPVTARPVSPLTGPTLPAAADGSLAAVAAALEQGSYAALGGAR